MARELDKLELGKVRLMVPEALATEVLVFVVEGAIEPADRAEANSLLQNLHEDGGLGIVVPEVVDWLRCNTSSGMEWG
jgi:hypothetical protein